MAAPREPAERGPELLPWWEGRRYKRVQRGCHPPGWAKFCHELGWAITLTVHWETLRPAGRQGVDPLKAFIVWADLVGPSTLGWLWQRKRRAYVKQVAAAQASFRALQNSLISPLDV